LKSRKTITGFKNIFGIDAAIIRVCFYFFTAHQNEFSDDGYHKIFAKIIFLG